MQKSQGGDSGLAESCQINVNIDFIDHFQSESNSLLLDQYPAEKEKLLQYCQNMHSEAAAQHETEQTLKQLKHGLLQQSLQRIFSSIILGHQGTQILLSFTVIQCDQDLMQALVNCASSALAESQFKMKCIPASVCLLVAADGAEIVSDPSNDQINRMKKDFTHKALVVADADKDEFIYSQVQPVRWTAGPSNQNTDALSLDGIEKVMGAALSACKKVHAFILE